MASRVCFDKQVKRDFQIHLSKLQNLKAVVKLKAPQEYRFLKEKLKKNALLQNRRIEVSRENKKLYEKIENIVNRRPSPEEQAQPQLKRESILRGAKRISFHRLQAQNEKMERRIRQQRSQFSLKQWLVQRKKVQQNINRISQYQYKNYKKSKSFCNFWAPSKTFHCTSPPCAPPRRQDWNQVYQKVKHVDHEYYNCVVAENEQQLRVSVYNIENSDENYELLMDYATGLDLVRQKFRGSFEQFVEAIGFDRKAKQCFLKYYEQEPSD